MADATALHLLIGSSITWNQSSSHNKVNCSPSILNADISTFYSVDEIYTARNQCSCLVYHIDCHVQKVQLDTAKTQTRKIIRKKETKEQKTRQTAMETKANGPLSRCPRHPSKLPHFLETTVAVKQAHIEVGMKFLFEPGKLYCIHQFHKKRFHA
jgi:hypothetical protein